MGSFFSKLFWTILSVIGGYIGYWASINVSQPSFWLTIFGTLLAAIALPFMFLIMFDDDAPPRNNPSLFERIAPLALLYWIVKDRDED